MFIDAILLLKIMSSTFCSLRNERLPLTHSKVDLSSEKEIFVQMNRVASETLMFLFSAISSAKRLYKTLHSRPIPPFIENTRGVNVTLSHRSLTLQRGKYLSELASFLPCGFYGYVNVPPLTFNTRSL